MFKLQFVILALCMFMFSTCHFIAEHMNNQAIPVEIDEEDESYLKGKNNDIGHVMTFEKNATLLETNKTGNDRMATNTTTTTRPSTSQRSFMKFFRGYGIALMILTILAALVVGYVLIKYERCCRRFHLPLNQENYEMDSL